ncbi:unnamed protein product [Polarella glacialis]|uniref:TauD/TfdA-like domain-containing protein n=1 Tax=Polarella glacialis TaxID=89957 RepID=A0A813JV40_POLGL|nr:unnamed protein product [Polarella glacialis]
MAGRLRGSWHSFIALALLRAFPTLGSGLAAAEPVIACSGAAASLDWLGPVGPAVPRRVDVRSTGQGWRQALEALWQDGAVILTGLLEEAEAQEAAVDFRELARGIPARLFGPDAGPEVPELLSPDAPVSGVHEELREAKRLGKYLPGSGLLPHTDGYVYGDHFPDFVFLLCEQPALRGGANALIDGQAVLEAMSQHDEDSQQLRTWLETTAVDLSEGGKEGVAVGRAAEGPVVQWHKGASGRLRLKWRRQLNTQQAQKDANWKPLSSGGADESESDVKVKSSDCAEEYFSLWKPLANTSNGTDSESASSAAAVSAKLRAFDAILQSVGADAMAKRTFQLERGEALVVDNYRVLHARLPYLASEESEGDAQPASERRFWRIWSWTSEGLGLPPGGAQTSQPMANKVFRESAVDKTEL